MPTITIESEAPEDFVRLAAGTRFGRGAARYRRADLAAQLTRFRLPSFVVARERGVVLGGCVLDPRRLRIRERDHHGLYRALLNVRAERTGEGLGRRIVAAALDEADRLAGAFGEPVLSYGCVDTRSGVPQALLAAHGARPIGTLTTRLLYRQWPRRRLALERAGPSRSRSVAEAGALVSGCEADCGVRDVTARNLSPWCWSDAQGLAIVAEAQVSTLSFDTLGRVNDALVAALVTPFGFARRRFDKAAFRHVRLSGLGVRAGAERDLPRFLDTLLAAHGCHHALLVIDPDRELAQRLRLHRAPASLQVMARWHGAGAPAPAVQAPFGLYPVDV